jgi:hypothetical protein
MYKINLKELRNYQKRVKDWPVKGFPNGKFGTEQNTMIKFTVPLLEILGWDTKSQQVEFEYSVHSVGEKIRKIRADVSLSVPGHNTPQVLVEVKRMRSPFESGKYLLRYLNKNSKAKYGIFTNGEELKLVDDTTRKSNNPCGLFSIKAEHFHKWSDVLSLLSFESVQKGDLQKFAKAYHIEFWSWYKDEFEKRKPFNKEDRKRIDYELRLTFARKSLEK